MTLVNRMKKALVVLLDGKSEFMGKNSNENDYFRSYFSQILDEEKPLKKFKELESLIFQLSGKITVLTDKVQEIDKQITDLTTLHEELLYIIDQNVNEMEQREDNLNPSILNSKEKKYGLN